MPKLKQMIPRPALWLGFFSGLFTGLLFRFGPSAVMTIGFTLLAPFAIGYVTIALMDQEISAWRALWFPWMPLLIGVLTTFLMGYEGIICIVMFIPIAMVIASLGGLIAYLLRRDRNHLLTMFVVVMPIISPSIEERFSLPLTYKEVRSQIFIQAPADQVWEQIKSIPTIRHTELDNTWVHHIGFPRPLDAIVDREGLGGVRKANFERGLTFDETIDTWDPPAKLGFSIKVQPVSPTTLDQHVTIGGQYFDVLHGTYEIEKTNDGVSLILYSKFRLSTRFNFYSAMWTELIMQRIQQDILGVIKKRAETA